MTDQTGFGTGAPAGLTWQNDSGAYTFGNSFRVTANGLSATKIRWYIPTGSPAAPTTGYYVALYEVGNTTPLVTAGPFSATVGAWNEQAITPTALTNGADYVVAVLFPGGYYGADTTLYSGGNYDPPNDLLFLSAGRYNSGSSITYPASSFGTPWYGIDVTVSDGAGTEVATLGVTLPALAVSLAGQAEPAAQLAVTLPAILATFAETPPGTATLAVTLPGLDSAFHGYAPSAAGPTQASVDISAWFTQTVTVERFTGQTGKGPTYAAGAAVAAMVDQGSKLVRAANGDTVVSSARVFLPSTTDTIPLGSRVTLPEAYGSVRAVVLGVALHLAPGMPVPEHLEVSLT